jgi:hypothetical protein
MDGSVASQVRFCLDRPYRPVACPGLWIEHGNQYDHVNSFFVGERELWSTSAPPILADHDDVPRLLECIGTRLMIKLVNRIDRNYPFVDNVKPFSRFLRTFGTSVFRPGYGPRKAAVSVLAMLRYLNWADAERPSDILGAPGSSSIPVGPLLRRVVFQGMTAPERNEFMGRLLEAGFSTDLSLPLIITNESEALRLVEFLAEQPELLKEPEAGEEDLGLGSEPESPDLSLVSRPDEASELANAAIKILSRDVAEVVIMGHTHVPVEAKSDLLYVNTGCWTRNYDGPSEPYLCNWDLLRTASNQFPFDLRFAEIDIREHKTFRLRRFGESVHAAI